MTRARTLTAMGLVALAALALPAVPAGARVLRPVSSFKMPAGLYPSHIAVDQTTGAVYVTGGGGIVEKFSASGVKEESFMPPTLGAVTGVAVDNASGDVYIAEGSYSEPGRVVKLDSSGGEVSGFPPIVAGSIPAGDPGSEGFIPRAVAVDPSNGDVVVAAEDNEIDIFSSSGVFESQFEMVSVGARPEGVAVGSGGDIDTVEYGEGLLEWSPADKYETPTRIGSGEEVYAVATDLSTGDLFVNAIEGPRIIEEYEASGAHARLLQFGSGLLEYSGGVAVNEKTDTVYATSPEREAIEIFGAPVNLPEVITGTPASGVTSTTAEVSGTIDPEGVPVTGCRFEYGLSTEYGVSVPCSPAPPLTGGTAITVTASLEVHPDETYHYRLVAVNANGSEYGEDETFQTEALEPTLQSESVSAVTQSTARLDASISPNDQETTYYFEYGTTTAYGTVLPAPGASIGSGYEDVHVDQGLSGLQPGTTYHYRVIASNPSSPAGGTVGPDQTFTTPPVLLPVVSTGQAVEVGQSTATLTGMIDTRGYQTDYEFDFGTDTGYGDRIFGAAGSEAGVDPFSVSLQGLQPGTTYHYRIAATNTFGTVYGVDVTFTTGTYPAAVLSRPVALPLLPAILLELEANGSSGAKATSVKAAAHAARRSGSRKSRRRRPGQGRKDARRADRVQRRDRGRGR
jgi:hypothetical protein